LHKHSLGLPLLAFAALAAAPAASSAATMSRDVVADVPHIAMRDLGPAPSSTQISVALTLRYRNDAQLDNLVESQSDDTSPLYRHWLTNDEFNAYFAPATADYVRTIGALQRAGFHITQTYPNRTVVDATAPVRVAERFFATQIHRVVQPGYGVRYANASEARMPASLQGLVMNVDGLNTLTLNHTNFVPRKARQGGIPDLAGLPLRGPRGGFGPLAFSQGYDLPQQHQTGTGQYYTGTGRLSGVVIDADFLDTDLSGFLSFFDVTRTGPATVRVLIDGGPPSGDGSPDSVETTLDVETIVSNAPGTALYVYEFPSFNSDQYITDAYNKVVSDNIVDDANSSFGGCDKGQAGPAESWDMIAKQGAAKGITFHASTGDEGSEGGCTQAPASAPHFVAVGGTSLTVDANGNWVSETGWSGGGGGVSTVFALPKWQKKIKNIIATGRNTPDVAFDANPGTGAAFYYGGTFSNNDDPLGGTSLASPIFAASITEWDQVTGKRLGLAGQKLFKFFKKKGYGTSPLFFHDITSGSNGQYSAGPGYDNVTGIGSMDVWNVEQNSKK
jgi:kumamolisin